MKLLQFFPSLIIILNEWSQISSSPLDELNINIDISNVFIREESVNEINLNELNINKEQLILEEGLLVGQKEGPIGEQLNPEVGQNEGLTEGQGELPISVQEYGSKNVPDINDVSTVEIPIGVQVEVTKGKNPPPNKRVNGDDYSFGLGKYHHYRRGIHSKVIRTPGEFEAQDAVWLIWSPVDHINGMSNERTQLDIIKALVPYTKVIVTAKNDYLYNRAANLIPNEFVAHGKVEFLKINTEELWTRDMGPNFVELSNGKMGIVDFNFDAWGYTPHEAMDNYTILMEKYDEKIGKLLGLEVISTNMYSEGGDREVNGKGTLIVVEAVEFNRNPGKSKEELNAEFKRVLGVSNIIWLKQGVYEDDHTFDSPIDIGGGKKAYTVATTGGHIDEFARFANANTILLAEVPEEDLEDPVAIENKKRLSVNYEILKNAVDQDYKPFNIVRVPTPKTILNTMGPGDSVYELLSATTLNYTDGSTFPAGERVTVVAAASYLNFIVSNNVIIGQKYWKEGLDNTIKDRDLKVKNILEDVFAGRKVIMIDPLPINYGGGGIHCITRHQPKYQPAANY